jgi:choline dehydrogenase-like flavoprotein
MIANNNCQDHLFYPDLSKDTLWDVIVIGTGMGGATTGYELAKKGHKVLFIEKGKFLFGNFNRGNGSRSIDESQDFDARLNRGCWPLPIEGNTSFGFSEFFAPLGSGTGGSTSLYAAQLERMHPEDFNPSKYYPDILDSSLPHSWPIKYKDFVDYYRQAEDLYRVRGTEDPLNHDGLNKLIEPPALSERDQFLYDSFCDLGLNPYRAHVACEFVENCGECGGVLCPNRCKNDAGTVCLMPALEKYKAKLLTECEVLNFDANSQTIKNVICKLNGNIISLKAKIFVLAAGSLFSPAILLKSKSALWPHGLANTSGYVGRNLMWHATDFVAVCLKSNFSLKGPKKALSLNDFYLSSGIKMGTFQSVGVPINTEYIFSYLQSKSQRLSKWQRTFMRPFILRFIAIVFAYFFRNAAVFAAITEDLPYPENRVILDHKSKSGIRFEYNYKGDLKTRSSFFRKKISESLKSKFLTIWLTGKNNINYGHSSGTCCFGNDPKKSVLNKNNRAHDVSNLYITDASFFPSSGGTNPSLTIAANAIRVSKIIDSHLKLQ